MIIAAHRQIGQRQFSQFETQTIQPKVYRQFGQFYKTLDSNEKPELELFLGLRSPVGALCARRRFGAITGSKFRIESYPLGKLETR